MVDFKSAMRNRPSLDKLVETAEKASGGREEDKRFWTPTRGKDGNGYAVIRFLPGREENTVPWIQYWDHAFKGPTGQWYIEKSLTTLGKPDPMSEYNQKMWQSSGENSPERKIVSSRSRNLRYVSNIEVITDPAHPENEGQVFLYRYGKKIHDKIMDAMKPKFPGQVAFDPFDLIGGADFVLRIVSEMVGNKSMPKYDSSTFKDPNPLHAGDMDKLETIFNKQFEMGEWIDPANYKSYDELKARVAVVLGEPVPRTAREIVATDNAQDPSPMRTVEAAGFPETGADDDDIMAAFQRIANS